MSSYDRGCDERSISDNLGTIWGTGTARPLRKLASLTTSSGQTSRMVLAQENSQPHEHPGKISSKFVIPTVPKAHTRLARDLLELGVGIRRSRSGVPANGSVLSLRL